MTTSRGVAEKGGALLTVLWVSAALAAIAFSISMSIRAETDRAGTAADGLRAMYLATGSVDRATQWLLWEPDLTVSLTACITATNRA